MGNWWWRIGAAALAGLIGCCAALAQPVLASAECQTVYNGVLVKGRIQVEDWTAYHGTYRVYGLFFDPERNRYEFEVMTNQPEGGVGGLWVNGMRHRETHVQVQLYSTGFTIWSEDGARADYECR